MSSVPDFLAIGHIARDVQMDGSFSLGGTVTYAALTAHRLGLSAAIVTCADPQLATELPGYLAGIALHLCASQTTTTFANSYHAGFRTQYLYARGANLLPTDVPIMWQRSSIVLLGPLAQELSSQFVMLFPRGHGNLLAATPQGWLRRWDADGRVWPTPWQDAELLLPYLDVLILSHDDLLPFTNGSRSTADAILTRWSQLVPLLIATDGRHGSTLFHHGSATHFPAYVANEVDPTGAGDVFAAAFLVHFQRYKDPAAAVNFANCAASFSVEQPGIQSIPFLEMVNQRLTPPTP